MNFENLSPELKAKALECKSTEELIALAESEGIELNDEQLEAVAGGSWFSCDEDTCGYSCRDDSLW